MTDEKRGETFVMRVRARRPARAPSPSTPSSSGWPPPRSSTWETRPTPRRAAPSATWSWPARASTCCRCCARRRAATSPTRRRSSSPPCSRICACASWRPASGERARRASPRDCPAASASPRCWASSSRG